MAAEIVLLERDGNAGESGQSIVEFMIMVPVMLALTIPAVVSTVAPWQVSARRFRHPSSKPRRRSPLTTRPRSKSGGR